MNYTPAKQLWVLSAVPISTVLFAMDLALSVWPPFSILKPVVSGARTE